MTKKDSKSVKKDSAYVPASVRVGRSKAGLGLFALEKIKKGDFIIEYVGKRLTHEEAEYHNGRYLFEVNSKVTIDGATRKNMARYINHSCKPNSEIEIKNERIFVFAKKNIEPGEEINYDYDDEYFDEFLRGKCICGNCPKYRLVKKPLTRPKTKPKAEKKSGKKTSKK